MIDDTQIIAIAHAFRTWERTEGCYIRQLRITDCGIQTEAYKGNGGRQISRTLTYFAADVLDVLKSCGITRLSEITILHLKDPDRYSVWLREELSGSSYRRYLTEGIA